MTSCVYVTDPAWAEALACDPTPARVNFWRKDVRPFRLPKGSFFYFKLRGSRQIAGRAIFEDQLDLSLNEAWTRFGSGNGVSSLSELDRVTREVLTNNTGRLNCLVLAQPKRTSSFQAGAALIPAERFEPNKFSSMEGKVCLLVAVEWLPESARDLKPHSLLMVHESRNQRSARRIKRYEMSVEKGVYMSHERKSVTYVKSLSAI